MPCEGFARYVFKNVGFVCTFVLSLFIVCVRYMIIVIVMLYYWKIGVSVEGAFERLCVLKPFFA